MTGDQGIHPQWDGRRGLVPVFAIVDATYCIALNMQQPYVGEYSRIDTARTSQRMRFYELRDHGSRIGSLEYQERLGAVL